MDEPIDIRNIAVIPFEVPNTFGWRFQVIVGGGPFIVSGIQFQARLGDQQLESIQISPDGTGFGGYIKDPPQDGDTLFYNYPGEDEVDTELAFRDQPA
jgi:hypothetical protein